MLAEKNTVEVLERFDTYRIEPYLSVDNQNALIKFGLTKVLGTDENLDINIRLAVRDEVESLLHKERLNIQQLIAVMLGRESQLNYLSSLERIKFALYGDDPKKSDDLIRVYLSYVRRDLECGKHLFTRISVGYGMGVKEFPFSLLRLRIFTRLYKNSGKIVPYYAFLSFFGWHTINQEAIDVNKSHLREQVSSINKIIHKSEAPFIQIRNHNGKGYSLKIYQDEGKT